MEQHSSKFYIHIEENQTICQRTRIGGPVGLSFNHA